MTGENYGYQGANVPDFNDLTQYEVNVGRTWAVTRQARWSREASGPVRGIETAGRCRGLCGFDAPALGAAGTSERAPTRDVPLARDRLPHAPSSESPRQRFDLASAPPSLAGRGPD